MALTNRVLAVDWIVNVFVADASDRNDRSAGEEFVTEFEFGFAWKDSKMQVVGVFFQTGFEQVVDDLFRIDAAGNFDHLFACSALNDSTIAVDILEGVLESDSLLVLFEDA